MSNNDFVSSIKAIPYPQSTVYDKLQDLTHLEQIRTRFDDPAFVQKLEEQVGTDKAAQFKQQIQTLAFTTDSLTTDTPMGKLCLRIVEREEPKCIKFQGEGAPVGLL